MDQLVLSGHRTIALVTGDNAQPLSLSEVGGAFGKVRYLVRSMSLRLSEMLSFQGI